jgi:hypothetical protein
LTRVARSCCKTDILQLIGGGLLCEVRPSDHIRRAMHRPIQSPLIDAATDAGSIALKANRKKAIPLSKISHPIKAGRHPLG